MNQYTIYHVVGIKVGCTKEFVRRCDENRMQYGAEITIEVLEELAGDDIEATKREAEWAVKFGYDPGTPYASAIHARREAGRRGGNRAFSSPYHNSKNPEHQRRFRAAAKRANRQTQISTCPHCNKVGQSRALIRWHFENCKLKPGARRK